MALDMLTPKVEEVLNNQVRLEGNSSHVYLAMASWASREGLEGVSSFLYQHAEEERGHMLKLIKYINERGGVAVIPALDQPPTSFDTLRHAFEDILEHEIKVTKSINGIVEVCLSEKDYTTQNFIQWYVSEQLEEETLARHILDKLNLIGDDKGRLYLFDRDILKMKGKGE